MAGSRSLDRRVSGCFIRGQETHMFNELFVASWVGGWPLVEWQKTPEKEQNSGALHVHESMGCFGVS